MSISKFLYENNRTLYNLHIKLTNYYPWKIKFELRKLVRKVRSKLDKNFEAKEDRLIRKLLGNDVTIVKTDDVLHGIRPEDLGAVSDISKETLYIDDNGNSMITGRKVIPKDR